MENDKIHDYTDVYLESYLRALDKTHNSDLAIQTAMGVTMVLRMIDVQNEPKQPVQPQINPMAVLFGAMMQQAAKNQQEEGNPEGSEIRSRATTMNKSEKYSEIILLGQMLQERKIEHEQHDLYDGYQIIVPLPEPTKEISVIEHQCSYGSIMNLLEIWADGSIQGYLSAKQTLKIIECIKARESPR